MFNRKTSEVLAIFAAFMAGAIGTNILLYKVLGPRMSTRENIFTMMAIAALTFMASILLTKKQPAETCVGCTCGTNIKCSNGCSH